MAELSERLYQIVQENADAFGPGEGQHFPTGAILITEWTDGDGSDWVSWTHTSARGSALTSWRIRGLIDEVRTGLDIRALKRTLETEEE